jgi:hypothetical protein
VEKACESKSTRSTGKGGGDKKKKKPLAHVWGKGVKGKVRGRAKATRRDWLDRLLPDAVEVGKVSPKKRQEEKWNGENRLGEFCHQQPKSTVGVRTCPH